MYQPLRCAKYRVLVLAYRLGTVFAQLQDERTVFLC